MTTRWHLPGPGIDPDGAAPWTFIVRHAQDGTNTHRDQIANEDIGGTVFLHMETGTVELPPTLVCAVMIHDPRTYERERATLVGGVGFFSDLARTSLWLSVPDEDERRRRVAGCVDASDYPRVLTTARSRRLARDQVYAKVAKEWGDLEPAPVVGYLTVVPPEAPPAVSKMLYGFSTRAVCNPLTTDLERAQLIGLLRAWSGPCATDREIVVACCLAALAADACPPTVIANAERLLTARVA